MSAILIETPSARYQVVIGSGLLATLFPRLRKLRDGRPFRSFLVTSPNIWALWHERLLASFPPDAQPTVLFLPPGERHKRLPAVEALAEQLAQAGADRDALLLAFGGGVIGDITGFLAAIYMRGVPFVQLPTTLLAQVDSSVGGKTGVNLRAGKNLIGAFHHPLAVLADTDLLATLPPAELRSGLQEAVKSAIIYDPRLFRYMEIHADDILNHDPVPQVSTLRSGSSARSLKREVNEALTRVVTASVRIKAEVVSQDEKETGLRMILNFGHTLGHAIEAATGYKQLLHGQAIGWGMIAAAHLSRTRGLLPQKDHDRILALILRYGPLPRFTAKAEKLVALTAADKKNRSGQRAFILATAIGSAKVVKDVTQAELLDAANAMLTLIPSRGKL